MSYNKIYDEEKRSSLEGKILVASPYLDDPYFSKSLVYICAHDSSGTIGIMVNQKIGTVSCEDFFFMGEKKDSKKSKAKKSFPLIFGGPVNTDMLIALSCHKSKNKEDEIILHTDVSLFLNEMMDEKKKTSKFVVAKGVSAWDSEQLEEEIAEGSWFVTEQSHDIIFSQKITDKWEFVINGMEITPHKLVQYSGQA